MVMDGGFRLAGGVAGRLYPHQVAGVTWLWSLHRLGRGGILADDMVRGVAREGV
jgi:SNF2 family DNA or RNA helicase